MSLEGGGSTTRDDQAATVAILATLEQPTNILDREAAGRRSATLNKLLFDDAQAGIILGVSTELLKLWRREGGGPQWVRIGKLVRYRLGDLRAYAENLPAARAA